MHELIPPTRTPLAARVVVAADQRGTGGAAVAAAGSVAGWVGLGWGVGSGAGVDPPAT